MVLCSETSLSFLRPCCRSCLQWRRTSERLAHFIRPPYRMSLVQRNESECELKSRRPVKLLVLLEKVRSRSSAYDVIDMKYAISALKEDVARIVRAFGDGYLRSSFHYG